MPRSTFASNPLTPPLGTSTPTHTRHISDYRDTSYTPSRRGLGADDTGMEIKITSRPPPSGAATVFLSPRSANETIEIETIETRHHSHAHTHHREQQEQQLSPEY